jgi:Replication regulatory protein RepB
MVKTPRDKQAMTVAERQAAYRARHRGAGGDGALLNVTISAAAKSELERLARHHGLTQRAMIERLIADGRSSALDGMTAEQAAQYGRTVED